MKAPIRRMMRHEVAKGVPLVRAELVKRGFRGNTLSEMAKNGTVHRIKQGVYAPSCGSKSKFFDYELAASVMPKGVFTLRSALRLHGITDDNPQRMTMSIPSWCHSPKTSLPIDFVYMTPTLLERDVEEHSPNGTPFRVFSLERTLTECFKARNKIGMDICVKALRESLAKGVVDHKALWDSMRQCRMTRVMGPYLKGKIETPLQKGDNPSPLRYPGGKFKIHKLMALLVGKVDGGCETYIEPFAGGAGVALELLLSGIVERIVINDSDQAIASIWKAMTKENAAFLDKMWNVDVTLSEWNRQREIYLCSKKYSLDYGFAAFFLNRTNHSGILSSGPIGGRRQDDWKLDVRFNKERLAKKIKAIGELRDQIKVYNRDVFGFIRNQLPKYGNRTFVYFDPPYYSRGNVLYRDSFNKRDHRKLKECIVNGIGIPWVVTYDNVPEIQEIYRGVTSRVFSLNYSLANNGSGQEIMFFSGGLEPTEQELRSVCMESMLCTDDQI